jgi:Transposase, Mutator family
MAKGRMDLSAFVGKLLAEEHADVLREGVRVLAQALMEAEVTALVGVEPYERSGERAAYRNGYRLRTWDTRVGTRSRGVVGPCGVEHPMLERDDGIVVDRRCRPWPMLRFASPQQAVLDQPVRADQENVAGEGRLWLVREVAIARGAQRQRLPPALARPVEAVDPLERGGPDITDAVGRWQRRDVQEHARGAVACRKRRKAWAPIVVAHGLVP